jgi:hypothetical protein
MFNTQILAGSSGQGGGIAQQSLKFNDDESQYLSWTPAAAGNRTTWTWSGWVKRGALGTSQNIFSAYSDSSNFEYIRFESDNTIRYTFYVSGSVQNLLLTSAVYRDVGAWYHVVVNRSGSTSKIYVNGVEQALGTNSTVTANGYFNHTVAHNLGRFGGASQYLDGYLSNIHFIDGQALDATSFGETVDGYWKAKDYAGTYGTNGFRLTFEDDVVSEGFNTVTYTGNGGTQSVSGIGFQPDFVWVKERSSTSGHQLVDSVRGAGKRLYSNLTSAENTNSNILTSFDGDGFSIGNDGAYNANGDTYVGWCWDAGSGSAASNTDGSITSTVKANPAYGFSIVSYTGSGANATVGHGLSSSAPSMIIAKRRDTSENWPVYTAFTGSSQYAYLDLTNGFSGATSVWQGVDPTSSVFSIGTSLTVNSSGGTYIAYCFAEVAGYSSIGSFTGNGSASGPTVTTNFNPAFLLVKRTDTTGNWFIWDNTRDTDGVFNTNIHPNSSAAEAASGSNFVTPSSTGFQLTGTGAETNASGGTYIYMAFADTREAAFWKDVSGQGNHWTPNNLDYRDSLIDSPANNFATLNPTDNAQGATFSEGNLRAANASATDKRYHSTFGMTTGKWYWEVRINTVGTRNQLGIWSDDDTVTTGVPDNYAYLGVGHGGQGTSGTYNSGAVTASVGNVLCFAFDADSGELYFAINATPDISSTASFTGLASDTYLIGCRETSSTVGNNTFNFGQDSTFSGATTAGGNTDANGIGDFKYPVPAGGYLALCSASLPTPTIVDGSEHFNTVLYTGTGASTLSITGVGFQPDWVWAKKRSAADNHAVADVVRGVTKSLFPNTTGAESTDVNGLQSFDTDGFTIGSGSGSGVWGGNSGATYAAWNWKAGGTAVSNTDGSITSQVSANVDAGFSVLTYSPSGSSGSVGHGLGVTPSVVIVKRRDTTGQWVSHWSAISGTNKQLYLSGTNAVDTNNISSLTSTTFSVSGWSEVATAGGSYVAYCFADVEGYLKAGSYTGNGSTDGTFVYTGFRPAWVMIKRTNNVEDWLIVDATRSTHNDAGHTLFPNLSDAENNYSSSLDLVSNGFKLRNSGGLRNGNGDTYIYLAFAETPLKFATAR